MTTTQQPKTAPVAYISLPLGVVGDGERRLDGEAYLTGGYAIRLQIQAAGMPFAKIMELAEVWQPSRLKGIGVTRAHGVPFLTATQVFDIRPTPRKWLAVSRTPEVSKRYLKAGWILVTCSGNVGDAIISYTPHLGTLVSHDLLRVEVRSEENRGFLYCFLRSHYGRSMLRSSKYGSIIKHLEPEHLNEVPVPLVAEQLRKDLQERIAGALRLRSEAYTLLRSAEDLYAAEFESGHDAGEQDTSYSVSAAEMFRDKRRLDAYHYNPSAEAALTALNRSGKKLVALDTLVGRTFGVPRFKHVYTRKGTAYLDSEDIFKINPEVTKFIPPGTKKNASAYYAQRGWLLMACSGQLYGLNGNVVLANEWHEDKILSNHIIRIVLDASKSDVRAGYLQMVLGHPVFGRPLVLRHAFGTEVPEISPEDLKNSPVPRIGQRKEAAIADRVERANALNLEADTIENYAVQALEQQYSTLLPRDLEESPTSAQ